MTTFSKKARWIGTGEEWFVVNELRPSVRLRKVFTLGKVKDAECLICGLGVYVLYINGKRVGDDVLSPAITAYDKRALFVRYQVGSYLQTGENVVCVELGDGFYNQTTEDTWHFHKAPWRNSPRLLFDLIADGESVLYSDTSWKTSKKGATVHNAVRGGEWYDARKEDSWREVSFDDSVWEEARIVAPAGGILEEQVMPPIRECETLPAVKKWRSKNGWIFDFGKNVSGYAGLCTTAKCGTEIRMVYAEEVKDGELDTGYMSCYLKNPVLYAENRYIFAGREREEWKPQFSYQGFRYIEVIGLEDEPPMDAFTAYFVHTDLVKKGDFCTSNELLNWIYEAGVRSFLSNYHGIPEDCPHREKNGWTGDAALSSSYAVVYFDMKEAYIKWLKDFHDAQRLNGQLPGIIPTSGWGYNWGGGPAWDFALFALPFALYRETGDETGLDLIYEPAKKYLDYVQTQEEEDGLVCFGIGDWCFPNLPDPRIATGRLVVSCYYAEMLSMAAWLCRKKGELEKAQAYETRRQRLKTAIYKRYVKNGIVDWDGQGATALVLAFRIVEGDEAKRIAKRLVEIVEENGFVFKVGILGIKAVFAALSEYGYTDIAYRMVNRYEYPSFGYWKSLGATTLWEHWDYSESHNHHMYGEVLHWMFRHIAGIQNTGVAYDTCVLKPYFFDENCSASARTQTPRGELSFAWKKEGKAFTANIVLPKGTNATLVVENREIAVESGEIRLTL